ncbi:unnamed protein product, partial [Meganyctiphanes norvegica]
MATRTCITTVGHTQLIRSTKPRSVTKLNAKAVSGCHRATDTVVLEGNSIRMRLLVQMSCFLQLQWRKAIVIDPIISEDEREKNRYNSVRVDPQWLVKTIQMAAAILQTTLFKKIIPTAQKSIVKVSGAKADVHVEHGDVIEFGGHKLEVRSTPGHTNGCITYVSHAESMAFTGDALLIRGCGRTDFQEGSATKLYDSVHSQIFTLPSNYLLYPAHDYKGLTVTTVEEEKDFNPRLTHTQQQFVTIMENLGLPYPKKIDVS